jgi:hypothetical protein
VSGVEVGLVVGAVVIALVLAGLALSRSHTLDRRVGSFHCAFGRSGQGPWSAGTAQYGAHQLYWWRRASLAPRPAIRWERAGLSVVERRAVEGTGQVVVTCRSGAQDVFLQMSPEAYAGLTSWIEATPSRVGSVI